MHYGKKANADVELSEELISDYVYNARTGRIENFNSDKNGISSPSCVEFLSHSEKFSSKSKRQ